MLASFQPIRNRPNPQKGNGHANPGGCISAQLAPRLAPEGTPGMTSTATSGKTPGTDRQFVTSLARGLRFLAAFGPDDRTLSNQELALRTGLPRPTVARFTHTLCKLGYLMSHDDPPRFSLAPKVVELSHAAYAATGLRDIARPAMATLSEMGDVSISLAVPSGLSVRYIEMARRPQAIVLNLDVGALVPLPQTAIGRAYLAALPEDRRAELMAQLEADDPATWAAQKNRVAAAVAAFPELGYAASFGDWKPELNAIATAIRITDEADPLLLSIGGLSSILTPELAERDYIPALLSTARAIGSRLRRHFL